MTQWSNPTTPFPFCWLQTHKHARSWSQLINRARMLPTARSACQPVIKENASASTFAPRTICIQNIPLHSCLSRSGLQSLHLKHEGSRQIALWQPNTDDCKYKEGTMVRLTASIIEQKGPQSVCLPLWRASRLAGLAAYQYYRCCCCHGQPQQLLAGLLKPAPGWQPAACLLYTINLCSLEMVQGCGEAPRHNCPARLPKLRQQWSGRGESAGARNEWRGRMRMEPWRICKL